MKKNWIVARLVALVWAATLPVPSLSAEDGKPNTAGIDLAQAEINSGRGAAALRLLLPPGRDGDPEAAYWLGRLYFYDFSGVRKDYSRSAAWFARGAKAGHAGAQYKLGGMYFAGRGVREDKGQAAYWWRKAALQRHPEALNNLAAMLAAGLKMPRNIDFAYALQTIAAELGSEAAQENIRNKGDHPAARHMAIRLLADPEALDSRLVQLVLED